MFFPNTSRLIQDVLSQYKSPTLARVKTEEAILEKGKVDTLAMKLLNDHNEKRLKLQRLKNPGVLNI